MTAAATYKTKFSIKLGPFQVGCDNMGKCDVERHISKGMHISIAKSMKFHLTLTSTSEKV